MHNVRIADAGFLDELHVHDEYSNRATQDEEIGAYNTMSQPPAMPNIGRRQTTRKICYLVKLLDK